MSSLLTFSMCVLPLTAEGFSTLSNLTYLQYMEYVHTKQIRFYLRTEFPGTKIHS